MTGVICPNMASICHFINGFQYEYLFKILIRFYFKLASSFAEIQRICLDFHELGTNGSINKKLLKSKALMFGRYHVVLYNLF